MRFSTYPGLLLALSGSLLALLGCSGPRDAPTSPASTSTPPPQSFVFPDDVLNLGAFDVVLDPAALTAELTPVRQANAVGDVYNEIGLTDKLRVPGALSIGGIKRVGNTDYVELILTAVHPFPIDLRPDLSVFNLKVHVVAEGTDQVGPGLITDADLLDGPDGFSTIWDGQADKTFPTAATLHPYRILSRNPGRPDPFEPLAPSGYNVWAPGATASRDLRFLVPAADGPRSMRLFLTADYGQSATRATRDDPQYDLPRFAGRAPYLIDVNQVDNTLAANDRDSFINLSIDVFDWGHNASLGTDVTEITCDIPDLDVPQSQLITPTAFADPLTVAFTFLNTNAASEGLHYGLVTAFDEPGAGTGLADDLVTPFTVSSYSTYQIFPIQVGPPTGGAPTAVISAPCEDVTWWAADLEIAFSGLGSFDDETTPDLLIYEWDLSYTGSPADFNVDRTGQDILWIPIPGDAGARVVALRVTDEDGLSHIVTFDMNITAVPGGPFANLTNLTNTPDREEDIGRAQTGFDRDHMVIDADGNVHIFSLVTFFDTEVTTYDFGTGIATGPELVFETEYLYSVPIVRTAPDGTIHLLYMAADDFTDPPYTGPSIAWRTYDPVTRTVSAETVIAEWFTPNPQAPTSNTAHMQGISFDIDADNNMFAVYEEWWSDSVPGHEESAYDHNMFTIRGTSAGGWEPAAIVPWNTYTTRGDDFSSKGWKRARPDVRVTDDNAFHLVYLYNPEEDLDGPLPVWHRTYDYATDTFSAPQVALNDTGNRSYAQLMLFPAPGGNLVMTHQTFINDIWYQRWTKSTDTWIDPVAMADETTNGGLVYLNLPMTVVTPDGTVWVSFQSLNSPVDLEEFYYKWFPFDATPTEIFNAPNVPLVPCIGPEGQREPQMVVDPARDRLIVVFEDPEDVPENDLWLAWKSLP